MRFFAIRYFAIKTSYTLFPIEDIAPKDFFITPFLRQLETNYYQKKYTSRILRQNNDDRYILGYLLKSKDTNLIHLGYDLFDEKEVLNWEKLFFVIDKQNQLFVCEHNSSVASPENVKNVLNKLVKQIDSDGYDIKLEFIVDKFAFWKIIKDAKGLYQIGFDLNAPNLFGGSKKANEWLKNLKSKHNMSSISVHIRNDKCELNYDEDELESYRDYADSGGGNWTLGILQNNNRKKSYSSSNHLKTKELEIDPKDPKEVKRTAKEMLSILLDVIEEFGGDNED